MKRELMERTMCLAAVLMMGAFTVFGCGDAAENAPVDSSTTEMTEAVITPTEPDTQAERETELQAEKGPAEPTEQPEEEVLFRIVITEEGGAYLSDQPSSFEYNEIFLVDCGIEFDVYEIFENSDENEAYYRVKMEDGRREYVWEKDAQIIE